MVVPGEFWGISPLSRRWALTIPLLQMRQAGSPQSHGWVRLPGLLDAMCALGLGKQAVLGWKLLPPSCVT